MMRVLICDQTACKIFREGDRYFIEYDEGDLVVKLATIEVSRVDAEKAQRSEKDAYEVIIGYQRQRRSDRL